MGILTGITHDLRYGARTLAASRGFTAVALVSLALGICVATCAISELRGLILRDVPAVAHPAELALLEPPASYPNYQRYRTRTDLFSDVFAYAAPVPFGVSIAGRTDRIWGHIVTPSYFTTLEVGPALGRFFTTEDEQAVVVSDHFWRAFLSADPAALGRALRINGQPCTIIGIAPNTFQGASPMVYTADLWLPVSTDARTAPELAGNILERHDVPIFHVVGRLRPGIAPARAEAELDTLARQLEIEYGDPDRSQPGRRVKILPGGKVLPIPKKDLPFLSAFFIVLGGMVLAIAASNVANMTLARAAERRREMAIRLALGCGRFRLVRQLLTESLMVAIAAGVLGYALATWVMAMASNEKFPFAMPVTFELRPDLRVLLVTLFITALTGFAFGIAPALAAARTDLTQSLARSRRHSLRNLLVLSQVAGSLALLLVTGFLVIGHQKMVDVNPGFDAQRLYLVSLDPVRDGYSPVQAADFFPKLLERVRRLPAVTAASLADGVPMSVIGRPGAQFTADNVFHWGRRYLVDQDFFRTFGVPVLSGRTFRKDDESVAIVSEKMTRECWGEGVDPIGHIIEIGSDGVANFTVGASVRSRAGLFGTRRKVQIVGVVANVRDGIGVAAADSPGLIYEPLSLSAYERPGLHGLTLVLRAAPGANALAAARREIQSMDDKLTVFDARSMPEQIEELLFPVKVALYSYGFIGIAGLVLAAVGLAGVTAYAVTRRRREIGIRVALGAQRRDVLSLVMKESVVLVAIGVVIGLVCARGIIRVLSAALFSVSRASGQSTSDPVLLLGAPALLACLAIVACYVPARRSTQMDPVEALRQE